MFEYYSIYLAFITVKLFNKICEPMEKIQTNLLALPLNATIYQTFIGH
jgi:hypothetical protein